MNKCNNAAHEPDCKCQSISIREQQKDFGFIEGITKCETCKKTLESDNAHWAFGQWWHKNTEDCYE